MKLSDLDFKQHSNSYGFSTRALVFFDNGFGASVITGEHAYSDDDHPYELAVMKGNAEKHSLTYETSVTDDVIGYLDEKAVSETLRAIEEL